MNTVRTHVRHIYEKLGAHSRTEAVELARALWAWWRPPLVGDESGGSHWYADIKAAIPGISDVMLTRRLGEAR